MSLYFPIKTWPFGLYTGSLKIFRQLNFYWIASFSSGLRFSDPFSVEIFSGSAFLFILLGNLGCRRPWYKAPGTFSALRFFYPLVFLPSDYFKDKGVQMDKSESFCFSLEKMVFGNNLKRLVQPRTDKFTRITDDRYLQLYVQRNREAMSSLIFEPLCRPWNSPGTLGINIYCVEDFMKKVFMRCDQILKYRSPHINGGKV